MRIFLEELDIVSIAFEDRLGCFVFGLARVVAVAKVGHVVRQVIRNDLAWREGVLLVLGPRVENANNVVEFLFEEYELI